jgi:hypothetical protein
LSVTTDPLTVAVRLVGGLGAMIGAPVEAGSRRDVVVRVGQPAGPKALDALPLVKQDHDTGALACVPGAAPGCIVIPIDGAAGERPASRPQADTHNTRAVISTVDRVRIRPPPDPWAGKCILKNAERIVNGRLRAPHRQCHDCTARHGVARPIGLALSVRPGDQ